MFLKEQQSEKKKMSLTSDSCNLANLISEDDTEALVELFEEKIEQGNASDTEILLCGIMLLLPPFADYDAAKELFKSLFNSSKRVEAAIWDGYRHAILMPDDDKRFEKILKDHTDSAVVLHILSLNSIASDNYERAVEENRNSREIRLFPFNLIEYLKNGEGIDENINTNSYRLLNDLIIKKDLENDQFPTTLEGLLSYYWDNLIIGTRITSLLWSEYEDKYHNKRV